MDEIIEEILEDIGYDMDCNYGDLDFDKLRDLIKKGYEKQLSIQLVSQQRELLPEFLYEDDGIIKVGVHGDSAVTDEWNDYLKKLGNCG